MKTITDSHLKALKFIDDSGETNVTQTANEIGLNYFRTWKIINDLEENGFVHMKKSPTNKSKVIVYMTAKGRNKLEENKSEEKNMATGHNPEMAKRFMQKTQTEKVETPAQIQQTEKAEIPTQTQQTEKPIDIDTLETEMECIASNMQRTVAECAETLKNNLIPLLKKMETLEKLAKENDIDKMPEFINSMNSKTNEVTERIKKDLEEIHELGKKMKKVKLKATRIVMILDNEE